jgi:hypothetical protein
LRSPGLVARVVIGGLGNLWAGAPVTPENTMFQTEPLQLPKPFVAVVVLHVPGRTLTTPPISCAAP